MAAGNGKDHRPVDTLFIENSHDAGIIEGIGHVIVREARLADIWPYMGAGSSPTEFGMRMLAASLEVNGRRFSFEEFGQISFRHVKKLQTLFPEVNRVNGVGQDEDADEEPAKNVEGAATSAPDASVSETGS